MHNFHIPKISLLSFSISIFIYSTFSIVLIVFPVLLFQCPLFRLPHVISSNQSSLSVGDHIFPIRGHLFHSYFFSRCHISSFPLYLTVSLLSFSNFFTDSCRIFPIRCHLFHSYVMYTNCQIPNFLFVCFFSLLLFQFPFFLSIVSEFPHRLSILGITFKM